ncbi:MAG TPA: hypothetical protein VLJ16_12930, partial [Acidobacteriota bacterium]|nr:hypothetical protein [Acidobacteriota bacterium]
MEVLDELVHALVSVGEMLGQRLEDDVFKARREVFPEPGQGFRLLVEDRMDQRPLMVPFKREDPREHLVEDDSQRPDVRALVDGLAFRLFRRHIGDRAHGRSL